VLDYNPQIIKALRRNKINCIYGEIRSPEIFYHINIADLKLVISTVPEYEDNSYILKTIKKLNPQAKVILTGSRISETKDLYDEGADYVIMPKVLAGEELKHILSEKDPSLKKARIEHLKYLEGIHKILY
jgi:voltage-gated potassium channel Kch